MTIELPEWYPLANATDDEIELWLAATSLPYPEMRAALPWLNERYEFDCWIEAVREGRKQMANRPGASFPEIGGLPLPPRRLAGRAAA